ncbi:MAG: hypothetical protein HKN63_08760 [Rhodobacteraceae bacterium]|nr:hypothetical protein [Paracoccaceae bacterium]
MRSFIFLQDRGWRRSVATAAFGWSFWGFFAAAAAFGLICWAVRGGDVVALALREDVELLVGLAPRVLVALSIASLIWVMLPRDRVSALVGRKSGVRGLVIATVAGTITPGGPSSAYSLLAVMGAAGADRGALIAYITAWATLGMQRILIWDVPFMGSEFAILRFLVSLLLPVLAGLIARRLPFALQIKDAKAPEREA